MVQNQMQVIILQQLKKEIFYLSQVSSPLILLQVKNVRVILMPKQNKYYANLDLVLEAAGTSKENIMKVTIFISDISHWDTVNEII